MEISSYYEFGIGASSGWLKISIEWSQRRDSNLWPAVYETAAHLRGYRNRWNVLQMMVIQRKSSEILHSGRGGRAANGYFMSTDVRPRGVDLHARLSTKLS
jgi:hypothetical protein